MTGELLNKYAIRFFIKHPDIAPEKITKVLGITPDRDWKVGMPRFTPTGRPLEGFHKETYWNHTRKFQNRLSFNNDFWPMLDLIYSKKDFVCSLTETGGHVEVDMQLFGLVHTGDVMHWNYLEKLSNLKIHFGIEVFPEWN